MTIKLTIYESTPHPGSRLVASRAGTCLGAASVTCYSWHFSAVFGMQKGFKRHTKVALEVAAGIVSYTSGRIRSCVLLAWSSLASNHKQSHIIMNL
eukprot:6210348-Pleurochrysis_carterae.AAC.2